MEIQIRELTNEEHDSLYEQLIEIFAEFYAFLESFGLEQNLAEDGGRIWLKSIEKQLGKMAIVFIALEGDKIIGFSAGNLRINPKFLGGTKVGHWSHLFVKPPYRKAKIGKSLSLKVEKWFYEKQVSRIETGVLDQNEVSKNLLANLGYGAEYIIMTKKDGSL